MQILCKFRRHIPVFQEKKVIANLLHRSQVDSLTFSQQIFKIFHFITRQLTQRKPLKIPQTD